MGFFRQEYWIQLPFPPPGYPRDWTHVFCVSCVAGGLLPAEPSWKLAMLQKISECVCVCVCVCVYVCVLVTQSCLILCDPMDCSPTWILSPRNSQVRILEWVAIPFSRVSSWSRDWTQVSCIVGWFFTIWATMKTRVTCYAIENNWKKQNPILKSISTSSPISGSIMPSCVWARNSSSDFKSK